MEYVWRITRMMTTKDYFVVGLNAKYEFNIENMKKYEITDKFKDIVNENVEKYKGD